MKNPVTFINVVEVEPSKQQEVIDVLREGTEQVMSKRPGFSSVTILSSLDKGRVVNIARWDSAQDVAATQSDPAAAEYAKRTAEIASAQPGVYAVVAEYTA